jgi:hypothetical protein
VFDFKTRVNQSIWGVPASSANREGGFDRDDCPARVVVVEWERAVVLVDQRIGQNVSASAAINPANSQIVTCHPCAALKLLVRTQSPP